MSGLPKELEPLARLFEKDEPRVLVVVGAGVSIGATGAKQASWRGLLEHGLDYRAAKQYIPEERRCELYASLKAAFDPFDVDKALRHAELIELDLKTPDDQVFTDWLAAAFRGLRAKPDRSDTLGAIRDLQEGGALILTTNYDNLLTDATGRPPVTWEDHGEFLRVINREQRGILHIHGHWKRPSSIVLGTTSYNRIVEAKEVQDAFKSLWLEWSWLYVGCGDGLNDPNLGLLLHWGGQAFGVYARKDYFLAQADNARLLNARADKPPTLIGVGFHDYADLPGILRAVTPAARCWPFAAVDAGLELFRDPKAQPDVPFPSQQEYLDGQVPALAADATVKSRLDEHGWAFVFDVASVGKTTLALRVATSEEPRAHAAFYLDLAKVDDDSENEASAALRRLTRPHTLLIIDNSHHQPELARRLWTEWKERPRESRLLMLGTRIHREAITHPAQDLVFLEKHATNPAVEVKPQPDDLGRLLSYLLIRVMPNRTPPRPPTEALRTWHQDYGSALGGFCFAVLNCIEGLFKANWELPTTAAAAWVRKKWVSKLDADENKNAVCLAVFAAQEIEMQVPNDALPCPSKLGKLFKLGLVSETRRGQFGQYRSYGFREPGWGGLILAAQPSEPDAERIRFDAARRNLVTGVQLNSRLNQAGRTEEVVRLWTSLRAHSDEVCSRLLDCPLRYTTNLIGRARQHRHPELAMKLWEALEREPDKLAARAWETPLHFLGSFLNTAKSHGRDTVPLWEALEREPDKLVARAWETPLGDLASFLSTAKSHGRDTAPLWEALEREPDKLAARAWETPLHFLGSFLNTAKSHGRDIAPLWEVLEREPDKLVARAWETSLTFVASFLSTAKSHGRDTTPLWEALEREPDKLVARAWETPLHFLGSFLNTVKSHGRDIAPLWEVLEREPDKLVARAWETSLTFVASFLSTAKSHGRDTTPLWEALEREPDKLVARAWETPLGDLASFLSTAKSHGRDTAPLWEALEREPDKLVARPRETPLGDLASFLSTAKSHARDTMALWEALEREPDKLVARPRETPLGDLASFLSTAKSHGRDTVPLWEALEREPRKLVARAWETPLSDIGSFLDTAKSHGRDTAPLWEALEREPDKLVARPRETPLGDLASFLSTAKSHGRDTAPLWEALEREPDKLVARARETPLSDVASFLDTAREQERTDFAQLLWNELADNPLELSERAKRTSSGELSGFVIRAPDAVVSAVISGMEASRWESIPESEVLVGGAALAQRFGAVGREDHKRSLVITLLRRANYQDFSPFRGSIGNVAWILENVPDETRDLVPRFLDALCTKRWLGWHFTKAACGALAAGLWMLAMHQTADICRRFHNASLGIRLGNEIAEFAAASPNERHEAIQLVGTASLFGWAASRRWFAHVALEDISRLPVDVLPHAKDATRVEPWQCNLWLGLRTVASVTGQWLKIPHQVICQTLDLWKANLAESATQPVSREHRLNQSMVGWLQQSQRCNALLPSHERLWDVVTDRGARRTPRP